VLMTRWTGHEKGNQEANRRRAENLARIEAERQAKVKTIMESKASKAASRADEQSHAEAKDQAERQRCEELARQRDENIQRRAAEAPARRQAATTKMRYAKRDVVLLKEIFDQYDTDGGGSIGVVEMKAALKRQKEAKEAKLRVSGGQEPAKKGVELMDVIDNVFSHLGRGTDSLSFHDLLKAMFPLSTEEQLRQMENWVKPEEERAKAIAETTQLSETAIEEMRDIFNLYDSDRSGSLSVRELVAALEDTGMLKAEIEELFEGADENNDGQVTFEEFTVMMASSDLFQ